MTNKLTSSMRKSELRAMKVEAAPLFPPGPAGPPGPPVSGRTRPTGATSAKAGLVMTDVTGVPSEAACSIRSC